MNWKMIGAVLGGLALGALIIIVVFLIFSNKKEDSSVAHSDAEIVDTSDNTESESTEEYKNESGFLFTYPISAQVTENIPSKNEYANLVITNKDQGGKITLVVSDTNFKNIADVMKKNDINIEKAQVNSVPLADLEATEYTFFNGKIVTGVIDNGALLVFTVEPEGNTEYWQKLYGDILGSFAFEAPEGAPTAPVKQSAPADSGEIEFEGEEVIE
jgi:hypothetical protein